MSNDRVEVKEYIDIFSTLLSLNPAKARSESSAKVTEPNCSQPARAFHDIYTLYTYITQTLPLYNDARWHVVTLSTVR